MNCPTKAIRTVTCLAAVCLIAPLGVIQAADDSSSPFNGENLAGWTANDGEPVAAGWEVVDGVIHRRQQEGRAGNIVTAVEFGDFDLSFEFKIAAGGNSGLKYRVRSFDGRTLGCEYQIMDEPGASHVHPTKNDTGSLYDVYEPNAQAFSLNPDGEFNSARIVVQGDWIQHWLNGRLIVSATVGDAEWERRIADSKFSDVQGFGRNRFGKLMLTDHGSEVWYRNFRLRPIEVSPAQLAGLGSSCNQVPVQHRRFGMARYCRRGWFRRR